MREPLAWCDGEILTFCTVYSNEEQILLVLLQL